MHTERKVNLDEAVKKMGVGCECVYWGVMKTKLILDKMKNKVTIVATALIVEHWINKNDWDFLKKKEEEIGF